MHCNCLMNKIELMSIEIIDLSMELVIRCMCKTIAMKPEQKKHSHWQKQ